MLNATGVVLHTNLGRAPLAAGGAGGGGRRWAAATRTSSSTSSPASAGSRFAPLLEPLRALTGAEDALVVNNCAAATLLVLTALAEGREVVVSRGELVEIGGGFRIPDVMRQSHATLVEVGTTNRTRRADYERALSPATALVTKVHRSNFALVGFTEETSVEELARLCQPRGVPLFVDAGSGLLAPLDVARVPRASPRCGATSRPGPTWSPSPATSSSVGRRRASWWAGPIWVSRLRAHPLSRALRVDKLTVAALEATLRMVQDGRGGRGAGAGDGAGGRAGAARARRGPPAALWRMPASAPGWSGWRDRWEEGPSRWPVPRPGPASSTGRPRGLAARLRTGEPAVLGRIEEGHLVLDVRCLEDPDLGRLAAAVATARERLPGA